MIAQTGILLAPAAYIAVCAVLTLASTFAVARMSNSPAIARVPVAA
jgi:hypothetical protein